MYVWMLVAGLAALELLRKKLDAVSILVLYYLPIESGI